MCWCIHRVIKYPDLWTNIHKSQNWYFDKRKQADTNTLTQTPLQDGMKREGRTNKIVKLNTNQSKTKYLSILLIWTVYTAYNGRFVVVLSEWIVRNPKTCEKGFVESRRVETIELKECKQCAEKKGECTTNFLFNLMGITNRSKGKLALILLSLFSIVVSLVELQHIGFGVCKQKLF